MIDISEKIKEISIAEFFEKNRHLLGYENAQKALFTVVKEFVDNSLDACIEARILPEIYVEIKKVDENVFRVYVEDNGPGVSPKKVPIAFGKFLVGSKFHRLRVSIGTQGIGAKGAILYAQLTTGKPAKIKVGRKNEIHYFELMIDTQKNEPKILKHEVKENKNWHGLAIEVEIEGRYTSKIDEYLKLLWLQNPFTKIVFVKDGEKIVYDRITDKLPQEAQEIKPHPYGIELGTFLKMVENSKESGIITFLTKNFSRISTITALKILKLSGVEKFKEFFSEINFSKIDLKDFETRQKIKKIVEEINKIDIKSLEIKELEKIFRAMQRVKLKAPSSKALYTLDEKYLIEALKKLYNAEFYAAVTRKPKVYRGFPFQVQVAIAYGVKNEEIQEQFTILRFANHTPLLYNANDCVITKAINEINWSLYKMQDSKSVILVNFVSVWIPYKSEGKQAIAEYEEIEKEIKLALQECARKVLKYVSRKIKAEMIRKKKNIFERYIPEVASSISILTKNDKNEIENKLKKIADKILPEIKI